jgi:hypothetical protein
MKTDNSTMTASQLPAQSQATRLSLQLQRMMMMSILISLTTLTSCDIFNDPDEEDPDSGDPGTTVVVTRVTVNTPAAGAELTAGGATLTLTVTIEPPNATDKTVIWSSSNTAVATVTAAGVVTGLKEGTATINAATLKNNIVGSCTVRVQPKSADPDPDPDPKPDPDPQPTGKRIKEFVYATTSTQPLSIYRVAHTYNSDGTLSRVDSYDKSSKLVQYEIFTSNSDGTRAKSELFMDGGIKVVAVHSYNSSKVLQKTEGTTYFNETALGKSSYEYTFANGRKTGEVYKDASGAVIMQWTFNYDASGKRTTTTEKSGNQSRQYTRTYNSDGTWQKVTCPFSYTDNSTLTRTFTWENGKSTVDEDIFYTF